VELLYYIKDKMASQLFYRPVPYEVSTVVSTA